MADTKKLDPTQKRLKEFLKRLDTKPEKAGQKYELIRAMLLTFFECRGGVDAEECTDETIDRVAKKIYQGENIKHRNAYCREVARFVRLEYLRKKNKSNPLATDVPDYDEPDHEEKEHRLDCLNKCLGLLTSVQRELFVEYNSGESKKKKRKKMAGRLNIPLNALRIRVHHIRVELRRCVEDCIKNLSDRLKYN